MSILITVLGVSLGYAFASVVHRRTGRTDARRWLLLVPVWVVYVVLLVTAADMGAPLPRGVQAFTTATVLVTLVDLVGAPHRRATPTSAGDHRAG